MKTKTPFQFDKGIKISSIVTLVGIISIVLFSAVDFGLKAAHKLILTSVGVLLFLIGFAYLIYCASAKKALEELNDRSHNKKE